MRNIEENTISKTNGFYDSSEFGKLIKSDEPLSDYPIKREIVTEKHKVSDLCNVIHKKLDMRNNLEGCPKPFWARNNIKVYEPVGFIDSRVDNNVIGRVVEGPVDPTKYFQGVPPPSHSQVKSQCNNETKPPVPPSKSLINQNPIHSKQSQDTSTTWSKQNPAKTYRIPYEASLDPRFQQEDIDDTASIISSCISTFGESSEIAGFSAAAEQRRLYESYQSDIIKKQNLTLDSSILHQNNKKHHNQSNILPNSGDLFFVRSLLDNDDLTPFGHITPKAEDLNQCSHKALQLVKLRQTNEAKPVDLETSELLIKPKSPAPYSTDSNHHYGTLRRFHKRVPLTIGEKTILTNSTIAQATNEKTTVEKLNDTESKALENDKSGDQLNFSDSMKEPVTEDLKNKDFKTNDHHDTLEKVQPWNTNESNPTLLIAVTEATNLPFTQPPLSSSLSNTAATVQDGLALANNPLSTWYRDMFKLMHKQATTPANSDNDREIVKETSEEAFDKEESTSLTLQTFTDKLNNQKGEKHGYLPSDSHCLQHNMRRLEGLLSEYGNNAIPKSPGNGRLSVLTAKSIFNFEPKTSRELGLNKGDVVRVLRNVDAHWIEGERNGQRGIFPSSYVQFDMVNKSDNIKLRAAYPFIAKTQAELNLRKGEVVTLRRTIDSNWLEGSNNMDCVGMFPASYVEPLSEDEATQTLPERPKTPKMSGNIGMKPQVKKEPSGQVPSDHHDFQLTSIPPVNQHYESKQFRPKKIFLEDDGLIQNKNKILMKAASLIPEGSEVYRAVYPYRPQKQDELALVPNDIVFVIEKCEDGWFIGTSLRSGAFGIFPGNYVKRH